MNNLVAILKVEDAYTRDIGKGIMRIDYDSMESIKAVTGDLVEIKGTRKTIAVCRPVYPSDEGKGIVRADGLVQHNAGILRGGNVTVRRARNLITKHVTVLPLEPIPSIPEKYLQDALDGIPVVKEDKITIPYFENHLFFQVVKASPAGLVSNQETKFRIFEKH